MTNFNVIKRALEEAGAGFGVASNGTFIVAEYSWGSSVLLAKKLFAKIKVNELWRNVYPDHILALTIGEELIVWNPRWRKKGCLQRDECRVFADWFTPRKGVIKLEGGDFKVVICPFPGR